MTSKRWNESDDPQVWAQRVAYLRARALSGGGVEPNVPAITDEAPRLHRRQVDSAGS